MPDGSPGVNGRPEYVQRACEASLKRLGVDVIDLYFQHRVTLGAGRGTVGAMSRLVEQGKVRISACRKPRPHRIRRAQATFPITALQTSIRWRRAVETEILDLCEISDRFRGLWGARPRLVDRQDHQHTVLDQDDIRLQMPRKAPTGTPALPWSPACRTGASRTLHAVATRHRLAACRGSSTIVPIVGTSKQAPGRECGGRFAAAGAVNVAGAGRHFPGRRRRGRAVLELLPRLGL